ncbi:MAG TPA: hypothetical protein VMD08_00760 [Candidatus Baltobacteraceae bacterium]|nr:hypothetical protein [Candidatus Baltobacteraceae bacterium]
MHDALPCDSAVRDLPGALERLAGGSPHWMPFSPEDATAGVENELQASVAGAPEAVDLPLTLRQSHYYANCAPCAPLDEYLQDGPGRLWENSWVRFPARTLTPLARTTLEIDLLADKTQPEKGRRTDADRFFFRHGSDTWVRLPISYLLKLALADALGSARRVPGLAWQTGRRLLGHFVNDNSSPETTSFHIIPLAGPRGQGQAVARETAKRFLLTQLLVMYANTKFELAAHGQRALVYGAPHAPVRQRQLAAIIPDTLFRDLFMNPCLSGWDEGEVKLRYMHLCHEVLCRSQFRAATALKAAGRAAHAGPIPQLATVSLLNNGTHISLGSRLLARALADPASGFSAAHEKAIGDLVIKVVEHFLPLFVGTYSAAPYRLGDHECRPERVLGFLPHELTAEDVRALWETWRVQSLHHWPRAFWRSAGSRLIPDARILDYPMALASTVRTAGLDGRLGNLTRLKADLAELGVFDPRMAPYLPYRLREFGHVGFSGFEGRQHSLFPSFVADLGAAANLQWLITAWAFQAVREGQIGHADIPDDPQVESERRQFFFGTALGVGSCHLRAGTRNRFLSRVLSRAAVVRASRRIPGYLEVPLDTYRRALLAVLEQDGRATSARLGLEPVLNDLWERIEHPTETGATARLLRGIEQHMGGATSGTAEEFNAATEAYYRDDLRREQLSEALQLLEDDVQTYDGPGRGHALYASLRAVLGERGAPSYLGFVRGELLAERLPVDELQRMILLVLISVACDTEEAEQPHAEFGGTVVEEPASVR